MKARLTTLSTTAVVLILILLAGGALRAYKVVEPNSVPGDDAHAYFALAKSLYEDGSFGGPDFNNASDWSPGAPLLYAALFKATGGPREGSIRALQALIGLVSILVAFALGRRLTLQALRGRSGTAATNSTAPELTGLFAAAGVAFYPPFIHSTGAAMSEPLAVLLLGSSTLALLWARERSLGLMAADGAERPSGGLEGALRQSPSLGWLLPGLLTGLLALTRPEYMAVGIAMALVIAWAQADRRIGHGILAATLFLLAMALPILPWTAHNLNKLDRLVPISTGSGKALFTGTFMPGDGDYQRTKAILAQEQLGLDLKPGSKELDAIEPRPLFDEVASRYPELSRDDALGKIGRRQLEEALREQPAEYAAMTARKVWRMWSNGQGAVMSSVPGRLLQVGLVLAGLIGLILLVRRRSWYTAAICALPLGAITAVGAITLASDRRGQVLMILIFPLAALAIQQAMRLGNSERGPS